MLSNVLLMLCAMAAVKADMVNYTLGGTTIMVDLTGVNPALLNHLQNGMPKRRHSGDESETSESVRNEDNNGHVFNSRFPSQDWQEDIKDHSRPSSRPEYSQNDFKKDQQGNLDIDVLPDSQLVYQHQPDNFEPIKPIRIDEAAGIYLGQESVPVVSENDKPSFYYSVETPDFAHVSQKIHNIVTSLNQNTAGTKLNDRAPVPIVPPIPDSQSFVNLGQNAQYPGRPGDIPLEMINGEGFTGVSVMHMFPKDTENYDETTTNHGDFSSFVSTDPIEAITVLGEDSPTEPYLDDQRINDNLDDFGSSEQEQTLLTKNNEENSQDSEGNQITSSEVTTISSDNSQFIEHNSEVSEMTNENSQKEENSFNSEFYNNDEDSLSTQEPETDLVTENPSEEQTSIPLEDVLLQKEEELSLFDKEEAQKVQKEQEDQMALEEAMADMFGSLFAPATEMPATEEELENDINTENPLDTPEENDISIKDSDVETEDENQQNVAVTESSDSTVENDPPNSEDGAQDLNQQENHSSSDPTIPTDNEQTANKINNSDKVAESPVALESPREEDKENIEKPEVNNQGQNYENTDILYGTGQIIAETHSDKQEVTSENNKPQNHINEQETDRNEEHLDIEANISDVQTDSGDKLQSQNVTQGQSETTQASEDVTKSDDVDINENVEGDDEGLSDKNVQEDQGTQVIKENISDNKTDDPVTQSEKQADQLDDQKIQKEEEQQVTLVNTSEIQGNSQPQTLIENTGQHIQQSPILTDFPQTRGEPEKTLDTPSSSVFHYSSGSLFPVPITLNQAAGIYINNEKIFNKQESEHPSGYSTRHDPMDPGTGGLLEWYDRDPIDIFDPTEAEKLTGNSESNAVTPIVRAPHRPAPTTPDPSINIVNVGRPTIPGHIPRPRPAMQNDTQPENDETTVDETPINTGGAVFHSAQPDLLNKDTCRCGLRFTTKIVGGQSATIEQFPWMAAIATKAEDFSYCGGSLLNDQYVLTAAHCLIQQFPHELYVRLGETTRDHSRSVNIDIEKFIIHPKYDADIVYKDDIALIKLAKPVEAFTDRIFPVCLAVGRDTFKGSDATVAGWGRNQFGGDVTQGLMEATVQVLSTKKCKKQSYYLSHEVHKKVVCALGPGIDACQGDSGGPLVVLEGDQYKQIGLVSWGIGCAQEKYPGIYTRISSYKKWILSNIRGANGCRVGKKNKNKKGNKRNKNKQKNKNILTPILDLLNSGVANQSTNGNKTKNKDDKQGDEQSKDRINWSNIPEALKGISQMIKDEKAQEESAPQLVTAQ